MNGGIFEVEEYRTSFDELKNYKYLSSKCTSLEERIKSLQSRIELIASNSDGVVIDGGTKEQRMELLTRLCDLKSQMAEQLLNKEVLCSRIEKKIDALKYPYNKLLYERFVKGKSLDRIAREQFYSCKQSINKALRTGIAHYSALDTQKK